jgi:hypothetical protein
LQLGLNYRHSSLSFDAHPERDGHAAAVYGDSSLFIIRPDNYVGLVTDTADVKQIREYLAY